MVYFVALCTLSVCVLWVFRSSEDFLQINLTSPTNTLFVTFPRRTLKVDNKSIVMMNIISTSKPQESVDKSTATVNTLVSQRPTHKQDNSISNTSKPQQSVHKSNTRQELTKFLEILRSKGKSINGLTYERRYPVLLKFSGSQIANFVNDFGVPGNLFSSTFNQQFLVCTGQALAKAKKPVNITNEGNVVMPKHFQKCKSISFQKNRKTVALLSFPGSGNSWVRQLLETTTGIYTGTYKDCDESYISKGMIGEGVYTDNVITVKLHFPQTNDLKWLYKHNIIYVVRNPFDAILAEWNRWRSAFKDHSTAHLSTTTVFGE